MSREMDAEALYQLLEARHDQYNQPSFIEEDPIGIPHLFTRKEDIEIAGFLTALIAWGRRSSILANAHKLVQGMGMEPYAFVVSGSEADWQGLSGFVHRTFNGEDCLALLKGIKRVYVHHGGLEAIFSPPSTSQAPAFDAIVKARTLLSEDPHFPSRTQKHLANPIKGSAAKRINMFLRWMVRKDKRGVDFGLWNTLSTADLMCPLDVHTGNVARKLGLLQRKQNDWKAVAELSDNLRRLCPEDPVKYDFSLFGLGVYEGW